MRRMFCRLFLVATLPMSIGAGFTDRHGALQAPEQYVGLPGDPSTGVDTWWQTLEDPELRTLIDQALVQNLDLRALGRQVDRAHALSYQSLSPLLPMAGIEIGQQLQPCTETGFALCDFVAASSGEAAPDTYTQGSVNLVATLGVDLWGEQLQTWRSARLEHAALQGDQQARALFVASQVGNAWLNMRHAASILALLEAQKESSQALLEETEARFSRAEASALDVLQQRQQLAALEAQIPLVRSQQTQAHRTLSAQLGEATPSLPEPPPSLPAFPDAAGLGNPSQLIERRPDVAAAWKRYEAAVRREQAAWRSTLPDLALSAQTGTATTQIIEAESEKTWAVGVSVSIPLLTGGAAASALRGAQAETDALHLSAQQALLDAVVEVESALALDQAIAGQRAALDTQVDAARLSHSEALKQYSSGLTPYLSVLTTTSALQQAELTRLQAQRDHLSARISLATALGTDPGASQ